MKIPIHFIETQPREFPVRANESPAGPVVCAYTRKQAVAAGRQIDVTKTALEAGIGLPTFITRAAFETYVAVPKGGTGQDEAQRLRDLLWATRMMIEHSIAGRDRSDGNNHPKRLKLVAVCSPLDVDDRQPALTLKLPEEVQR